MLLPDKFYFGQRLIAIMNLQMLTPYFGIADWLSLCMYADNKHKLYKVLGDASLNFELQLFFLKY